MRYEMTAEPAEVRKAGRLPSIVAWDSREGKRRQGMEISRLAYRTLTNTCYREGRKQ